MASSFFQKARDRAQEAASSIQQAYHGNAEKRPDDVAHGNAVGDSTDSANSTSTSGGGKTFTYTGNLPHMFRQGLAAVDPRFESTRSLHQMRGALKGVIIDDKAVARETKAAAVRTFKWGQDHKADKREDGVGDEAIVDVTDRLAYILSTIGDLEMEHANRLTAARASLKAIQQEELELASRRAQRVKLSKELQNLVAERSKPGGNLKADEMHKQLEQLEREAAIDEQILATHKRQALQQSFDAQFDSYIQHGEKMALVASYGKLLMEQLPAGEGAAAQPPPFPANKQQQGWEGQGRTAQVRSLIDPALKSYQISTRTPQLPSDRDYSALSAQTTGMSDAASFQTTHAHELAADDDGHEDHGLRSGSHSMGRAVSSSSGVLAPLPEGGSPNPRWNHSPSIVPAALGSPTAPSFSTARSGVHRVPPPLSPHQALQNPFDEADGSSAQAFEDSAPPGPTVAETGAILASSPSGPGPISGTLKPRRKSSVTKSPNAKVPVLPPRPGAVGSTSPEVRGSGPIGHTTPAALPASVAGATVAGVVHARLRRDGTITRRGIDHDFEQAEADGLPPYTALPSTAESSVAPSAATPTMTQTESQYIPGEFTVLPGWFVFDDPEVDLSKLPQVVPNFGLRSDRTWAGLVKEIERLNAEGAAQGYVYKLIFKARHGEGWHNVAEAKYSTEAWDAKWALLTGDGEMTWGPDPELTPLGQNQARSVNAAWKEQIAKAVSGVDAAPLPTRLFVSPFKRSCMTLRLSYDGIILPPGTTPAAIPSSQPVDPPYIKEDLREQYGDDHEAVHRSSKSTIQRNFPEYTLEPGFTEQDERFKVSQRSALPTPVRPLIMEGWRENFRDEHTCDERSSRTDIAAYNPGWEIQPGFEEEDISFGKFHESIPAMSHRIAGALRDVFVHSSHDDVVHISSHSGVMERLWEVTGHRRWKPTTGAIVPLVVRWKKGPGAN